MTSDDEPPGRPLGPGEAARRLGVSTRTVQRWLREGRLPSVRVGGRLKVDPSAFVAPVIPEPAHRAPAVRRDSVRRPIRRLLVANRGELVVRIARTCRRLGIDCFALVPDDQARAWWARQADELVPLADDYLDGDAVLRAARQADADAIHPGYGFLAEDPAFAEAVIEAGLGWVGPPPSAMRALGDKAAGRRLAARVGVAVLPGYDGEAQDEATLHAEAERVGYPVLVKPSAGGGGKGMHIVARPEALPDDLARARREARAAFGDERLVLERYVDEPRHVEIQLLLDGQGNGVQLGERDCSLQRRHQKVIEESPSPAVDPERRARLGDAALRLASAAGYVGAGTAEFLLDPLGNAFFLEVNARLQVEHPVTELVTGRDLVADQLRIAAGETLGFGQEDVRFDGHAIEARLYAEDPWADFVPATGAVLRTRWPQVEGVRVDAGVGADDVVGTRYDPLLAKLIAHGRDRAEALDRLDAALAETSVLGVTSNRGFLRHMLADREMRAGTATTRTISRAWQPDQATLEARAFTLAAAAFAAEGKRAGSASTPAGFRLNARPRLRIAIGDHEQSVEPMGPAFELGDVAVASLDGGLVLDLEGLAVHARLAPAPTVDSAVLHAHAGASGAQRVVAPMPGTVLAVRVAPGDEVDAGQTLAILEAMKMENPVGAPGSGTVEAVLVEPGRQVQRGDVLVVLR